MRSCMDGWLRCSGRSEKGGDCHGAALLAMTIIRLLAMTIIKLLAMTGEVRFFASLRMTGNGQVWNLPLRIRKKIEYINMSRDNGTT